MTDAYSKYLEGMKNTKIPCKIFLVGGTMLNGKVNDFNDMCIILDKCMILRKQIISVVPQ